MSYVLVLLNQIYFEKKFSNFEVGISRGGGRGFRSENKRGSLSMRGFDEPCC